MIEVHNLTFGYSSTEDGQILKGVDFAAKTGKLTVLIGTNGAGKSTLLKTIMGILNGKGDITINGKSVAQYSTKDFSSTVSYLSQDNDCRVNLTVFEVVMLGRMGSMSFRVSDEDIAATQEVLERLNLQRFASRSIMELSGGQRQLVFMAQALVKEPKILILDEPTSALDPQMVGEVLNVMKQLASEGMTMVIVTHEMAFARDVSTRTIFMHEGVVAENRKSKELFANPQHPKTQEFLARFMAG